MSADADGRRTNQLAARIRSTEVQAMKEANAISCLFVDIGGVLLTNRWDHQARHRAATNFKLD